MSKKLIQRKGIVLAGGTGSRLDPLTKGVCKQLLPVYDKPMIYYPLSVLMLADISEVLIISSGNDIPILKKILGDGSNFGIKLNYCIQESPRGIAEALIIAEDFLAGAPSALILGDNLLFGQDLTHLLFRANARTEGATIFGYQVADPTTFGVVEFDDNQKILSIEEKPMLPKSNHIIPGLYFYDSDASGFANKLEVSDRGELEITCLNSKYFSEGKLHLELLGRGVAWLDMGTHDSLHRAAVYVDSLQKIHGSQIANLEEIAFRKGWISSGDLESLCGVSGKSSYFDYLKTLL